jgi:hypothetical protein
MTRGSIDFKNYRWNSVLDVLYETGTQRALYKSLEHKWLPSWPALIDLFSCSLRNRRLLKQRARGAEEPMQV